MTTRKLPAQPDAVPLARLAQALALETGLRPRLVLAYSGGLDSRVLLELLVRLRRKHGLELRVVHVNHHLQPAAGAMARAARAACVAFAVPCRVRHARGLGRRGTSLEAQAREARYRLLASEVRTGEILVTAQHMDDQAETLLLQLLRGAGVEGLAAMPMRAPFGRGQLLRPLLGWTRTELEALARAWRLEWVDDPSNSDERFDRNYVRGRVLPLLRARWPSFARTLARSAAHLGEAAELLANIGAVDFAAVRRADALQLEPWRALPPARQKMALRVWLRSLKLPPPDQAHLQRIQRELPGAAPDRHPRVEWPGGVAWREQGLLRAAARVVFVDGTASSRGPAGLWHWRRRAQAGLRWRAVPKGVIDAAKLPATLEIRTRQGGERLRPRGNAARRPLKDLLREARVPVRQRAGLPLIYADGELLAVGTLYVNHDHPAVVANPQSPGAFVPATRKS